MSSTSSAPYVVLNTGARMPLLGLGTYKLCGAEDVRSAVDAALASGYRAFDTAAVYRNEADLGRALRELLPKYELTREDVFITSKLGPKDQGVKATDGALHSLSQLDLDYIDLYLIHWPGTQGLLVSDQRNPGNRAQSWAALEELQAQGRLRAIGVSNYTAAHMTQLMHSCKVPPAVLQVEFHPQLCQKELRRLCEEHGVCFQAYSSLGKGQLLSDPGVMEVARGCGHTAAQVLLRWAVQQGVPVLPKSSHPDRMGENTKLFDFTLSDTDMDTLSSLDCGHKYVSRDPSEVLLRWAVQQGVPVLPKSSHPDRVGENTKLFDFTLRDTDMDTLSSLDCGHKYCWDPSEVLLRWAVQQGVPVLPKSSHPDRVGENTKLFDFTLRDTDMDTLSSLDCGHKYCWDPSEVA